MHILPLACSGGRFGDQAARSALTVSRPYDPVFDTKFDGHITSVLDEIPTDRIAAVGEQVDR